MPMLWVATAVVAYLREGLVAGQAELAELARRDPLTGAGNRRLLAERLRYELARHRRTGGELALLVLDLDRFKEVNDQLGHPAGDRLLTDVAAALAATVRDGDTVVRHGGDEFCVVAPDAGPADALVLADRIHAALGGIGSLRRPAHRDDRQRRVPARRPDGGAPAGRRRRGRARGQGRPPRPPAGRGLGRPAAGLTPAPDGP